MDVEEIKKMIKLASDAVAELEGSFKLEAFKIILQNSLTGIKKQTQISDSIPEGSHAEDIDNGDMTNPLLTLAKKSGIDLQEVKNVLDFENNEFILLKKMNQGTDAKNQVLASQLILTAQMKGLNNEWTKTSVLHEVVLKNNLGDEGHLAKNLSKAEIFRTKGKVRSTKYSLTTNGWQEGLKLITKLGQGN